MNDSNPASLSDVSDGSSELGGEKHIDDNIDNPMTMNIHNTLPPPHLRSYPKRIPHSHPPFDLESNNGKSAVTFQEKCDEPATTSNSSNDDYDSYYNEDNYDFEKYVHAQYRRKSKGDIQADDDIDNDDDSDAGCGKRQFLACTCLCLFFIGLGLLGIFMVILGKDRDNTAATTTVPTTESTTPNIPTNNNNNNSTTTTTTTEDEDGIMIPPIILTSPPDSVDAIATIMPISSSEDYDYDYDSGDDDNDNAPPSSTTTTVSHSFLYLFEEIGTIVAPEDPTILLDFSSNQHMALSWMADHSTEFDNLLEVAHGTSTRQQLLIERYVMVYLFISTGGLAGMWQNNHNFLSPNLSTCDWNSGGNDGSNEFYVAGVTCGSTPTGDGNPPNDNNEYFDKNANGGGNDEPSSSSTMSSSSISKILLANNGIQGELPYTELALLSNLQVLDVSYNSLTSMELFYNVTSASMMSNLRILDLSENVITGTIATEIATLPNLQILDLSDNMLVGTIPTELVSMSNLEMFHLSYNELSGTIPMEVGGATATLQLRGLLLRSNKLTGSIPACLLAELLPNLDALDLGMNRLSGSIPTQVGIPRKMVGLWLDENQITGSIPTQIGMLSDLVVLSLHNNHLNGTIPSSFQNLNQLQWLTLSNNNLEDENSNLDSIFCHDREELLSILDADCLAGRGGQQVGGTLPEVPCSCCTSCCDRQGNCE